MKHFTCTVWKLRFYFFPALYGSIFEETEAAFSNYRLWESAGFIAAFAYSGYLCVYIKLMILLGTLALGMMGYLMVEYRERKTKQSYDTEYAIEPYQTEL